MLEETSMLTAQSECSEPTEQTKRISQKQRKETMQEYRQTFLTPPKITDRQTVFISRELRDKLDRIVRQLGDRKLSVSGFVQNVLEHHLNMYSEDIEKWRKL